MGNRLEGKVALITGSARGMGRMHARPVRGMTKAAALELGRASVRVNSVHPGIIKTEALGMPALKELPIEALTARHTPLGRIGAPEEVSELLVLLASDASSYCTGSEFVIDGGLTTGVAVTMFEELLQPTPH